MSAVKALAAIVAIVFVAEFAIVLGLSAMDSGGYSWPTTFLNAALLALAIAPAIYWLVLLPLQRQSKHSGNEGENQELNRLAITDELTQIMNRRGITVGLLDALAQAERYGTPLSVALADVDRFKEVNDTYGHEAGNKALKQVAAVLSDALRMPDKIGRYEGEAFLIALPHTTLIQARKISDRIRASIQKGGFTAGPKKLNLTVSIGVAQFKAGEDLEQLLSQAGKALHEAKKGGRNLVVAHKTR